MKIWKRWIFERLTIHDLVTYFGSIGIGIDLTFRQKQEPRYFAHNSRLYRKVFSKEKDK